MYFPIVWVLVLCAALPVEWDKVQRAEKFSPALAAQQFPSYEAPFSREVREEFPVLLVGIADAHGVFAHIQVVLMDFDHFAQWNVDLVNSGS